MNDYLRLLRTPGIGPVTFRQLLARFGTPAAALQALPEDFRVAVVLRDVGDLDYGEIATLLDVPVSTVKSRIARGRAALAVTFGARAGNRDDPIERPNREP